VRRTLRFLHPSLLRHMLRTYIKYAVTVVTYSYVSFVGVLWLVQRKLQYFPSRNSPPDVCKLPSIFHEIQVFEVLTLDGLKLSGWLWPRRILGKYSHIFVLHLHGNAGSRFHRLNWALNIREQFGCAIALFDYRGYGGNVGSINETCLIRDGIAAITWASEIAAKSDQKLVLHLESIGSAIGLNALYEMSTTVHIDGIIVEGGLSSCYDVAKQTLKYVPVGILMTDKWERTALSASKINHTIRFLSLHGKADRIVPLWSGRRLYDAASCIQKEFVEFKNGGHNDLMYHIGYFSAIESLYKSL